MKVTLLFYNAKKMFRVHENFLNVAQFENIRVLLKEIFLGIKLQKICVSIKELTFLINLFCCKIYVDQIADSFGFFLYENLQQCVANRIPQIIYY